MSKEKLQEKEIQTHEENANYKKIREKAEKDAKKKYLNEKEILELTIKLTSNMVNNPEFYTGVGTTDSKISFTQKAIKECYTTIKQLVDKI